MREEGFISLGDPYLDSVFKGVPKGSLIIVAGNPGVGKTIFSANLAHKNMVEMGLKAAYLSFIESKSSFFKNMESIGIKLDHLERKG